MKYYATLIHLRINRLEKNMKYLYLLIILLSGCAQSNDKNYEIQEELLKTNLLSKEQASFVPHVQKCKISKGSALDIQMSDIVRVLYNQLSSQFSLAIELKNDKKIIIFLDKKDSSYDKYISNIYKNKTNLKPSFYHPLLKKKYSEIFSYLASIENSDKFLFSKIYQHGKFFADPFSNIFIRSDGVFFLGEANSYYHPDSRQLYVQYSNLNTKPCSRYLFPRALAFLDEIIEKGTEAKKSNIIKAFEEANIDIEELSL